MTKSLLTLLRSPYLVSKRVLDTAVADVSTASRADVEKWSKQASLDEVWLGVLHAKALGGAPVETLEAEELLVTHRSAALAAKRTRYARVAAASARCVAHLAALHGTSLAMQAVRHEVWTACFGGTLVHGALLERVVRDHDVLISGETGTGKELVAHALASGLPEPPGKRKIPFAELNAAAVPDTLVESELFGHTKGAFTGAAEARLGLVRSADGGCLFLDEVGDLPLSAQAKLLRVIETDQVLPLGSDRPFQVNVRFLAATHRNLEQRVREGSFRADLYQRLAGMVIRLPSLRERPEDVGVIGAAFVEESLRGISEVDRGPILRWLGGSEARRHCWPGNVRELRNVVRSLLLGLPVELSGQRVEVTPVEGLPERVRDGQASQREVEDWYRRRVLDLCEGNVAQAARVLGIDRSTLARQLKLRPRMTTAARQQRSVRTT